MGMKRQPPAMCESEFFIGCGVRELHEITAKVLLCLSEMRLAVESQSLGTKHVLLAKHFVSMV